MGQFRKAEDPNQAFLLPPSPRDWLPEGHLAWFILDAVAQLDLDPILDSYRMSGKGELPYPPRVMLRLLVYGYCTGVFSSRKIAAQIEDSIAFRVLASGLQPSHRTICRFREEHLDSFQKLFVQVVQVAAEAGLVKMGTLAIDGSKVKANASKHKAMSYERMLIEEKRLRTEIARLTRAAQKQDAIDDAEFGEDFRGDELPEELSRRKERLQKIKAAKARLEARKAAEAEAKRSDEDDPPEGGETPAAAKPRPKPKDQENFTDPDSRIMLNGSKAFEQSYNAQIAVDEAQQIIVAADVSQCASDVDQLVPMVNAAYENMDRLPDRVLADAGYKSEDNFAVMTDLGIDAYVSLGREGKAQPKPAQHNTQSLAMRKKVATKRGRQRYRKRKWIVEPVFGWVKRVLGFRSFSLRGHKKVVGEWALVCMATNLRRMATLTAAR